MKRDTRLSEISLPVGAGLPLLLAIVYAVSGIALAGFHYLKPWILPILLALLAAGIVCQFKNLRRRRNWRLVYQNQHWLLVREEGASTPVSCEIVYVSSWLVVAKATPEDRGRALHLAFLAAAIPHETWRQLHLLIKDGKQSHPVPQN